MTSGLGQGEGEGGQKVHGARHSLGGISPGVTGWEKDSDSGQCHGQLTAPFGGRPRLSPNRKSKLLNRNQFLNGNEASFQLNKPENFSVAVS